MLNKFLTMGHFYISSSVCRSPATDWGLQMFITSISLQAYEIFYPILFQKMSLSSLKSHYISGSSVFHVGVI